jgi:hypothetical protein
MAERSPGAVEEKPFAGGFGQLVQLIDAEIFDMTAIAEIDGCSLFV